MQRLMEKMKYTFNKDEILLHALRHSSYANESNRGLDSNERLEFLGDSVLSIVVSEYLFDNFPESPEGELSKLRARLVCEKSLAKYAGQLGISEFLLLGKGEENSGGRKRPSISSDAFEALIAAIYLDSNIENAEKFVLRYVIPEIHEEEEDMAYDDYKTQLQEIIQQNPEERITYVLLSESGPDHDKRFHVQVHLNSNVIGQGIGKSKKEAEQKAAKEALELMGC